MKNFTILCIYILLYISHQKEYVNQLSDEPQHVPHVSASQEVFEWLCRSSRGIQWKDTGHLSIPVGRIVAARDTKKGFVLIQKTECPCPRNHHTMAQWRAQDRDPEALTAMRRKKRTMLVVRAIRVENEFLHLECLNVDFVGVASCVWIYCIFVEASFP